MQWRVGACVQSLAQPSVTTVGVGGDIDVMSLWARHGEGSHTVDTPRRLALYQVWEIILS